MTGGALKLPVDTKLRFNMAEVDYSAVAGIRELQQVLAENLKNYWYATTCHLHCYDSIILPGILVLFSIRLSTLQINREGLARHLAFLTLLMFILHFYLQIHQIIVIE